MTKYNILFPTSLHVAWADWWRPLSFDVDDEDDLDGSADDGQRKGEHEDDVSEDDEHADDAHLLQLRSNHHLT